MSDAIIIRVTEEDRAETLETALGHVEDELDASISRGRGRPAEGEITLGRAVEEIAAAYAGVEPPTATQGETDG